MAKTNSISANSIRIQDSKGKTVIFMGVTEDGEESYPVIELVDGQTQTTRIELVVHREDSYVAIYDKDRKMRANLRTLDDGRSACGVYGRDGKSYAVSLISMNGDPTLEVRDKDDKIVFREPAS